MHRSLFPVLVILLVACQLHASSDQDQIGFSVRLLSIGVDSALFELVDDNVTAINYVIKYGLNAEATENSGALGSVQNAIPIRMITNPFGLLKEDEEEKLALGKADFFYDDSDQFGELFSFERRQEIKNKTYAEIHRFSVGDLDPNRNYEITMTITARLAHLQRKIVASASTPDSPSPVAELKTTVKKFVFKFKTLFDLVSAATAACEEFHRAQAILEPSSELYDSEDYYSSCYTDSSNCTECKPSCYQIAMNHSSIVRVPSALVAKSGAEQSKPILCEPCPCDTTKSTGDCTVLDPSTIKCTQCIGPYRGLLCKECKNEGVDYYKNEQGECMTCNCNGNSAYDVLGPGSTGKKLLKCQAGTGICIDCQFNTTGRHCHECRAGFIGDPMRRSCIPRKTINMSINFAKIKPSQSNYLNEKYNYRSLLLLSAYIFIILTLVLMTYFMIRMKYRHHVVLKHGPHESCIVNTFFMISECFSNMFESTRAQRSRLAFHVTWLCPSLVNRLRSSNLLPSSRSSNCCGANGLGNLNGFSNLNQDDRLNLAEHQVFDEGLMSEGPVRSSEREDHVNPFEDTDVIMGSSKNPYISLTSTKG